MTFSLRTHSGPAAFCRPIARAALSLLVFSMGAYAANAQQLTAPPTPRVEIFGGYAYVYPHAVISGVQAGGTLPLTSCLCGEVRGGGGSITYNFTRWFGLTGDVSGSSSGSGSTVASNVGKANFFAFSGGPRITYRSRHFVPFGEVLIGDQRLSPTLFAPSSAFGLLAGGGLDLPVKRHFAVRLFRADYVFSNQQFGPSSVPGTDLRGLRLESGVVFLFGFPHHAAPSPLPIAAPVPVAAPIAAAPVEQPLTLVLSASPSSIVAGQSSTITANATSPGMGTLVYSFQSNAGMIAGTGSTALLTTVGVAAGTIEVTGMVTDQHGQTATATTSVMLTAAAATAAITTSDLGAISFARDLRRPVRVDNEAKAMLDDIALNLQRDSDSQLALIGNAAANEANRQHTAAQRAVDTKEYLVQDKGIDPSRIVLYTGTADAKTVDVVLIPLGAKLDAATDTPVDESSMKAQPRKPLRQRTAN
jgi:hypothetical protein